MLAEIGHCPPPFALRDQHDRNATPLEDDVMGDPVVLVFDRNAPDSDPSHSAALLRDCAGLHDGLDGAATTIFVISRRSRDENCRLAAVQDLPFHLLTDEDGKVFEAYGIDTAAAPAAPASVALDANGRVVEICENRAAPEQMDHMLSRLRTLADARPNGLLGMHPPVLIVPDAMDADIRNRLIETWHRPVPLWDGDGMVSEGFDVERSDFKVRNAAYGHVVQYVVRDPQLGSEIDRKVMRRIAPQIEKAFGYRPSKREEYRIACYDVDEGGSLPAHRDNPTEATRHRRFTVSVSLNNESFEGGELTFRESSDHRYDLESGTAIVWSCALLHEVLPVRTGRRFVLVTHLFG